MISSSRDVGKVTNWFRNLRQTARKRAKKSGSGDDEDYHHSFFSAAVSRSGTPSLGSSTSSSPLFDGSIDSHTTCNEYDMHPAASDIGSDEDYNEILTPSPDDSPSPSPVAAADTITTTIPIDNSTFYAQPEKTSASQYSDIKVEDALLLLSFHQHVVH